MQQSKYLSYATNFTDLKIAPLLAQYLYTNKRLDLPGIGSFLLDPSFNMEPENPKQNRPSMLEGVTFENNTSVKESPELIQFISTHSGKIKALASADLDSHLQLARQFINIGKPFLFEGIGSLTKNQNDGGYSFAPGHLLAEKVVKETPVKETSAEKEENAADLGKVFYAKKTATNWKKPLVVLLLLAGIGLAIWGGYAVYKKTTAKNDEPVTEETTNQGNVISTDTMQTKKDTSTITKDTSTATPSVTPTQTMTAATGSYKFVIETATKERALSRFAKLSKMGIQNLNMETADSLTFKLFFIIPSSSLDTARIVDSLRRNYTPKGNRAYVEN
jgi:hypothetical protein